MNKEMSKFLAQRILLYTHESDSVQLWKRYDGFDIVTLENHDVTSVMFIEDYDTALASFDQLKHKIFNTKEKPW